MNAGDNPPDFSNEELLTFFKALADANRLKIIGLLAREELSVEQIAEMLKLRPSTISHHLSKLSEAGLVAARAESYYNVYYLKTDALGVVASRLLSADQLSEAAAGVDLDAYDRKIWTDYTNQAGKLKAIPAQRKKLEAVLRRLVQDFDEGEIYTERQVNQTLGKYHEDTAFLRRELVGYGLLSRDSKGESYWRE